MHQIGILGEVLMILGVAVALGCDAFTVGLAIGTKNPDPRQSFRMWFHFGLFQSLMTLGGWFLGKNVLKYIESVDHWIAFGLLSLISFRMFRESRQEEESDFSKEKKDPTRGWSLMALCIATSMDALGVGFGMSITNNALWAPATVIGLVAGIMTYGGIRLGKTLSIKFGKKVEAAGAFILFLIALKLLTI